MLKLYPLYSGSSGNMYLIKSPSSTIIVDIGVSFKSLVDSLDELNMKLSDVSALFITHEHSDHVKGLISFINKTNIPIYITKGTWEYIYKKELGKIKKTPNINIVKPDSKINIYDITVTPFQVSHDAMEPVGYNISCSDTSLSIATDLGYVSNDVFNYLKNSSFNVIESNYDRNLLMYGTYPYPLKCRIQSDLGHLSNEDSANTILSLANEGKRNFLLGHLSNNNNEPEQAIYTVNSCLKENGYNLDEFNICVASRDKSFEVYEIC